GPCDSHGEPTRSIGQSLSFSRRFSCHWNMRRMANIKHQTPNNSQIPNPKGMRMTNFRAVSRDVASLLICHGAIWCLEGWSLFGVWILVLGVSDWVLGVECWTFGSGYSGLGTA